jgi:hypothetical protein
MKRIVIIVALIFLCTACQVEGELTRDAVNDSISNNAELKYSGTFAPTSGITVAGDVKIYLDNGSYHLALDNFTISDGPDLKVYLSKTAAPSDFVNLGNLNAATVYHIPNLVDLDTYPYVLIHCQQYEHLYAIAPLEAH